MDNLSATGTSMSDEVFGYVPPDFLLEHGLVKGARQNPLDKSDLNAAYDLIGDENSKAYACEETDDGENEFNR